MANKTSWLHFNCVYTSDFGIGVCQRREGVRTCWNLRSFLNLSWGIRSLSKVALNQNNQVYSTRHGVKGTIDIVHPDIQHLTKKNPLAYSGPNPGMFFFILGVPSWWKIWMPNCPKLGFPPRYFFTLATFSDILRSENCKPKFMPLCLDMLSLDYVLFKQEHRNISEHCIFLSKFYVWFGCLVSYRIFG